MKQTNAAETPSTSCQATSRGATCRCIPRKLLDSGKLLLGSLAEYRQWQREHPEKLAPAITRPQRLRRDRLRRRRSRRGCLSHVFRCGSARELKGAHRRALRSVREPRRRRSRRAQGVVRGIELPNEPTPVQCRPEQLLHGATEKSALLVQEHGIPSRRIRGLSFDRTADRGS